MIGIINKCINTEYQILSSYKKQQEEMRQYEAEVKRREEGKQS
jgi:hypothetical protein